MLQRLSSLSDRAKWNVREIPYNRYSLPERLVARDAGKHGRHRNSDNGLLIESFSN